MRFIFKTDYGQDIKLAKHGGHVFWYGALMLLLVAAPWLFAEYWLAQLTFILIYAIAGLGLMLLAGFTGLFSLGHAAFLGVGAYTQAVMTNAGVPFPIALACAAGLSATVGLVVGLPALRVKGIYLGIATLSFGFIVEEVFARWESVTGGNAGIHIKAPDMFGWKLGSGEAFYFLCLVIAIGATLGILNLLRSPTGRAFVAIRDSEISAQSMGIHLARFDATVDAHMTVTEVGLTANITFPHSTGKTTRVAIAADKLIAQISDGNIDFDILLSTQTMIPKLAKVAKILGPKGLMPSPKSGTITNDPDITKTELEGGKTLVKTEAKAPLIHVVVGKISMTGTDLVSNISTLVTALTPKNILKLTLATSMSPGVKVDLAEFKN